MHHITGFASLFGVDCNFIEFNTLLSMSAHPAFGWQPRKVGKNFR